MGAETSNQDGALTEHMVQRGAEGTENDTGPEKTKEELIQAMVTELNAKIIAAQDAHGVVNRFFKFGDIRISIQAGHEHAYSKPKGKHATGYEAVELGNLSQAAPAYLEPYRDGSYDDGKMDGVVYAYAPIELVARWIVEEGGLKDTE